MVKPQQPELRRSGLGATDESATKAHLQGEAAAVNGGVAGPVPEGNRPGHHPEKEQDKPDLPPGA